MIMKFSEGYGAFISELLSNYTELLMLSCLW